MTTFPKFPVVSLIVCFIGVVALCLLGAWQVQRLAWKNNLQNELNREFSRDVAQSPLAAQDFAVDGLRRGQVTGTIEMPKSILLQGRVVGGRSMVSVVAPLRLADAAYVAVEIGCATAVDVAALRRVVAPESLVLSGVVRRPKWSYWTPQNNISGDDWWRLDVQQLAQYWDVPSVAPAVMTVDNVSGFAADLVACPVEKQLRNDHLFYAVFWFVMSGVLCAMWGLRFLRPYLQSA